MQTPRSGHNISGCGAALNSSVFHVYQFQYQVITAPPWPMSVLDTGVFFGFQLQDLADQQTSNCNWYTRDDRKYATQTTATFQPWEGNLAVTQTWYCDDNGADKP